MRVLLVALSAKLLVAFCVAWPCSAVCNAAVGKGDVSVNVFADIRPVAYLVEQVGGRHVEVAVLVPEGADPHVFEPTPRQVVALSTAKLFFSADLPLDRQIHDKIDKLNNGPAYVDVTAGIKKLVSSCGTNCNHDHAHEHGSRDPHVWLSPLLLRAMAENVAAALEKADPGNSADYRANLKRLLKRIDQADRAMAQRLLPHRGRTFYVFHPALGYLAHRYSLMQRAVQIEGRAPSPKHLHSLIKQARKDRIEVVFAQSQFDRRPAQVVARAIGAEVVVIDPLAKDVLDNLDQLSQQLANAMEKSGKRNPQP